MYEGVVGDVTAKVQDCTSTGTHYNMQASGTIKLKFYNEEKVALRAVSSYGDKDPLNGAFLEVNFLSVFCTLSKNFSKTSRKF